jgi:hypothetical protein
LKVDVREVVIETTLNRTAKAVPAIADVSYSNLEALAEHEFD